LLYTAVERVKHLRNLIALSPPGYDTFCVTDGGDFAFRFAMESWKMEEQNSSLELGPLEKRNKVSKWN
jgi:hypothetical protein